jgi:hypothetical protein
MIALFLGVKTESYSRGKNGFNDLRSWRKEYSKKLGSKKDQEKEEFLEEYLKEHFSEKTAHVFEVKNKGKTDIRFVMELKRDGWQHIICNNFKDLIHIVNGLYAEKKQGRSNVEDSLYPYGGNLYATEKGPGQVGRGLIGKRSDRPTGQNRMSRFQYIKNGKQVGITYRIERNKLIISDDKCQEIGRLELEPVSFNRSNNASTHNDREYEEKLGELSNGKTRAQVKDIVEKIKTIKKKNKSWTNNSETIKRFIIDALLDSECSNQPNIKLDEKTKKELDEIIKKIKTYMIKNEKWDKHLDQIIILIEDVVMD